MGAPAAVVAARFAWVGYRDKLPFRSRREDAPDVEDPDHVEADTCASS